MSMAQFSSVPQGHSYFRSQASPGRYLRPPDVTPRRSVANIRARTVSTSVHDGRGQLPRVPPASKATARARASANSRLRLPLPLAIHQRARKLAGLALGPRRVHWGLQKTESDVDFEMQ